MMINRAFSFSSNTNIVVKTRNKKALFFAESQKSPTLTTKNLTALFRNI